jgi:hypothetical protein
MPTCFVIMPIATPPELKGRYQDDPSHFLHVYEHLFKPAIQAIKYDPLPPSSSGGVVIQADIISKLEEADLVLCDISALNANVFFELGVRTALNKPVCMVKDDLVEAIPFDNGIVVHHTYDHRLHTWNYEEQVRELADHISSASNKCGESNPLWKYFGVRSTAKPAAGGESLTQFNYIQSRLDAIQGVLSSAGPRSDTTQRRDVGPFQVGFLLGNLFRLFYNPAIPGLSKTKVMRFAEGGEITQGKNQNENTWRTRGELLELVQADGAVHSRFYFSPSLGMFINTNDPDTPSLRNQYMVPTAIS